MSAIEAATEAAEELAEAVDRLRFADPVTHVYNPLRYAWQAHRQYLQMLNPEGCRVLFLGMNPGPWGMAQSGVPFGQIEAVKQWLGIDAPVGKPDNEHPKRPVEGLDCPRSEVSGQRLWGWIRERFGTPGDFFREHFVANYCPLVFMEASARNRTPDKLPAAEREPLVEACDDHLLKLLDALRPRFAVGVGMYAEKCLQRVARQVAENTAAEGHDLQVTRILHPSPASPAANRGWAPQATEQMIAAGVWQ
ncbi:uracil-DNA glycosylase family protein [Roseimaritima sediminicola]|uniref:uracil-DNA glycosylase family protein n=1 Tax=Roseimaritima sediminicola TaxID=2662066 RepID=UPI001F28332E|nr:uracil-DNA glycosylase family protein [Roseimaritima sediminicola]